MTRSYDAGSRYREETLPAGRSVSVAELQTAILCGEWDAEGAVVTGDVVLRKRVRISRLILYGSLRIEAGAEGTVITGCRLCGAVQNRANDVAILKTHVMAYDEGITDASQESFFLRDSVVDGPVTVRSDGAQMTYCTVSGDVVLRGGEDQMVAFTRGAALHVSGTRNTSILKNKMQSLSAEGNHALYVIENAVSGRLTLTDNNYIIADANQAEELLTAGNENQNGDNLTDVMSRPPVGADEALLPHLDKDLFVGKPRRVTVRDPEAEAEKTLPRYIVEGAGTGAVVIVPPGAYVSEEAMDFRREHSHTTVYAYGVYAERQRDLGRHMGFWNAESITVKGLFLAFRQQSCGQVYVVGREGSEDGSREGWVRILTGAGLMDEFASSDTHYFKDIRWGGAHRDFYAYMDCVFSAITPTEADGTRRLRMAEESYLRIQVGDVLTCRASNGEGTVQVFSSSDIVFYDVTMYGNAGAFAFTECDNATATTYYRVANTTRSAEIIDEETYCRYRGYEKTYGVDFELSIDERGRFRGSPCHIGSIDATHTMRCGQGSKAIFCLFENMCDDGTNQNHQHARLAALTEDGDGTATVLYKGMLPMFFYRSRGGSSHRAQVCDGYCYPFTRGQRVFVYTSGGQLVCDTEALTDTRDEGVAIAPEYGTEMRLYSVKVRADAVNFGALAGYDLSKNTPDDGPGEKVMVDNMTRASNGFVFDNTVVRNIRSRGLLIKASEGRVEHCRFENVGMSCIAILYEIFWGESGVTENTVIRNNLFDHTGFFENVKYCAPIAIQGLGSRVDEDYLLYRNILLEGNMVRNRTTDYAVYINSAKDIRIVGNDLGSESDFGSMFEHDVYIEGAQNVELSGNVYSGKDASPAGMVRAEKVRAIHGTDVTEQDRVLIPDSE